jgi:hypothetical protein
MPGLWSLRRCMGLGLMRFTMLKGKGPIVLLILIPSSRRFINTTLMLSLVITSSNYKRKLTSNQES